MAVWWDEPGLWREETERDIFYSHQGYSLKTRCLGFLLVYFVLFCFNLVLIWGGVKRAESRCEEMGRQVGLELTMWNPRRINKRKKQEFVKKKKKVGTAFIRLASSFPVFTIQKHRITLLTSLFWNRFSWLCTFVCVCDYNIIKTYFPIFSSPKPSHIPLSAIQQIFFH